MFQALFLSQDKDQFSATLARLEDDALPHPEHETIVAIDYSTINFKDGLALTNRSPVVRKWPMVPGIDGAGTVVHSSDSRWSIGSRVLLNGFGVGETHWGCLAQRASLNGDWLIEIPAAFSSFDAMAIGTAGYTAMLSVLALEDQQVKPNSGPILVTGASGGVGSYAVALLARAGFSVVASTGRAAEHNYLTSLGASEVIDRDSLSAPGKPMQKERFAGVIDSVGSHTLVNACAQTRYGGVVTSCGLAQGMDFPASVAPFILRAVRLIGIDSVMAPNAARKRAWAELAQRLDASTIKQIAGSTLTLAEALAAGEKIMSGTLRGRVVVDVNA
jgi:acrylyl-CoA reductase (NADPH)